MASKIPMCVVFSAFLCFAPGDPIFKFDLGTTSYPAPWDPNPTRTSPLQTPCLLLPRMGFLPCVAEAILHHFGEVAPDAQRTLWLEETCSGEPLRWHLPTGVLFDLVAGERDDAWVAVGSREGTSVGNNKDPQAISVLPWRITVHFQGCPERQVFPLEREVDIRRHYTNSLKQALYLQLGSSRVGMSLAKDKQTRLWQAVKTNDAKLFHEMDAFLGGEGGLRLVPVRLLRGGAPPSQLPIPTERPNGKPFTLRDGLCWFCPELPWRGNSSRHEKDKIQPTSVMPLPPTADLKTNSQDARGSSVSQTESGLDAADKSEQLQQQNELRFGGFEGDNMACSKFARVFVQGVEPPLDAAVASLWRALRHPDHFLYVVLRKS